MSARGFFERLPIPILQSPMLGASSLEMALGVSRAGGLGALAAGGLQPEAIGPAAAAFRARSDAPFSVNLLIAPKAAPSGEAVGDANRRLEPWFAELGLELPDPPNDFAPNFDAQFAALVGVAPPLASFAFACLRGEQVQALQSAGSLVMGTATTVAEARCWAEAGADAICAQGSEAGGHRGHFLAETGASLVGTMALVATIRAAVDLPVVAAGGVMDGRGVAAVLALGAVAAQMGTAFLLADETAISATWRSALETAPDDPTRLTRAFTGRHARGIENRFMRELRAEEDQVPDYPVQNRLTQPLRAAATAAGVAEMTSLWAGQGVKLATPGAAEDLVRAWWAQAKAAANETAARTA